jgi:hypothetical protein
LSFGLLGRFHGFGPSLGLHSSPAFFDETIFVQGLEELLYIVLGTVPFNAELLNDRINDLCLRSPAFEKFQDSRADEVEVEHLSLPDIQDNGAILAVRAADAF